MAPRRWRNRIIGHGEEDAEQLLANPRNWRIHPKEQQAALKGVLDEVGWVQNVIVNQRTGFVVDGHARVAMAISAGERVPVVYVDLSEQEEALVLATLDPLSAMAGKDDELLRSLIADIGDLKVAGVSDLLASIAPPDKHEGMTDPDEVPVLPVNPTTRTGDIWTLGRHRLICGDSTSIDAVDRLMGGEKASVTLTDPPYGIGNTTSEKNKYATYQDTRENLIKTIADFLPLAKTLTDRVVLTPGNGNMWLYPEPTWAMAWFTPAGVGRGPWGFCCWQPILCYGKDPRLSNGSGCHPDAIVHTEAAEKLGHPCTKPIKFWVWLMDRTCDDGVLVYEPFAGSGTTIIAAEQTGRVCYSVELDPAYCDVIVKRWQDFTGKQACNEDGETFESVAKSRESVAA